MSNSTMLRRALAALSIASIAVGGATLVAAPASAATTTATISGLISGEAWGDTPAGSLGEDGTAILLKPSSTSLTGFTFVKFANANEDGIYSFTGVKPGTYSLEFFTDSGRWFEEAWGGHQIDSIDTPHTTFKLKAGQSFTADAALEHGFTIKGSITGDHSSGEQVPDATVTIYDRATGEPVGGVGGSTTSWYRSSLLHAGTYVLQFGGAEDDSYLSEWYGGEDFDSATDVVITDADVEGYDAELTLGGTISGSLTSATGPTPWVLATAYDADGNVVNAVDARDGEYSVGKLPTGTYRIGFSSTDDGQKPIIAEFWDDVATLELATSVEATNATTHSGIDAEVVIAKKFTTTPTPTISGTAKVGSTLTAKAGTWKPAGATLAYTWRAGSTTVSNATTYAVTPEDLGTKITVSVTGTQDGFAPVTKTSKSTATVVKGSITSVTPKFTGTAKVGATLTAVTGTWKPAATTLTYQWLRTGKAIAGATESTYVLTAADRGKKISLKVTGSADSYSTKSSTSLSKTVASGTLVPAAVPEITGTPKVAETLTLLTEDWGPEGTTLSYQWYLDKKAISGATHPELLVPGSAAGKKVTVTVTGSKSGYTTATRTSLATVAVAKADLVAGLAPTISGTAEYGSTLTASAEGWDGATTLSYQWLRDGTAISGASKSTYKVALADRGHEVSVSLVASRTGYNTLTATSESSVEIPAVTATVDSFASDSYETDDFGLYLYKTSPTSVTVAGGEYFEFHAAPEFFTGEEIVADVEWSKGGSAGSKLLTATVSEDGSTLTVRIPTGSTLSTMKAKKKAGYTVSVYAYIFEDDGYTIDLAYTGLKF
jgi:hypothetical protein